MKRAYNVIQTLTSSQRNALTHKINIIATNKKDLFRKSYHMFLFVCQVFLVRVIILLSFSHFVLLIFQNISQYLNKKKLFNNERSENRKQKKTYIIQN